MKTLLVLAALLLANAGVFAQAAAPAKGAETSDVTTVHKSAFPREKFDPKRDPKADLQEAVLKASASGKRIILDVGGEWCGWCVYMDKYFLENPGLAKLRDENFVWIKINMSPENENKEFLSAFPEALGFPHLYVLDETGKLLHSQETGSLESGKGYNLQAFTEFLNKWSPPKK